MTSRCGSRAVPLDVFRPMPAVWGTESVAGGRGLARRFLEGHCVDTDGRMFFQTTRDGRPLRKRRYLFSESFYVVGMAEYAAAFGDAGALDKAEACFDLMLRLYREPSSDPYKITPKTYASTREERSAAVPMVLLSSAQVLRRCDPGKAAYYEGVAREIADDLLRIHYQPTLRCVLETVLPDGSHLDNPAGRTINPGHSCENAWFLMNQAQQTKDRGLLEKALQILDWSLERGWDEKYGGILYFVDVDGRPCEQLEWDMKLWWVHNEALISTLTAYKLTGEDRYWRWFEKKSTPMRSDISPTGSRENGTGISTGTARFPIPRRVPCGRGPTICRAA